MPRPIPDMRSVVEVEESRDMTNYKPYRTAEQKVEARRMARLVNGTWFSSAPRTTRDS